MEITEGGVARVNGNLAVSRGFGDKDPGFPELGAGRGETREARETGA